MVGYRGRLSIIFRNEKEIEHSEKEEPEEKKLNLKEITLTEVERSDQNEIVTQQAEKVERLHRAESRVLEILSRKPAAHEAVIAWREINLLQQAQGQPGIINCSRGIIYLFSSKTGGTAEADSGAEKSFVAKGRL